MTPIERKTCTHCRREKPVEAFARNKRAKDGWHAWCRTCLRVSMGAYRRGSRYRQTISAYLARPEVRRKRREIDAARARDRKPAQRQYRKSVRARLLHSKRQARFKLRRATNPDRRRRLHELLAQYNRELKRMEA